MTNVAYADFGTLNENTEPHAAELEEGTSFAPIKKRSIFKFNSA